MTIAYYDIIAVALIAVFLVLRFRYHFASRSIIVLACMLLVGAALAHGLGSASFANDLAILAFYSIVVGVALLVYDQVRIARGPMLREGRLTRSLVRMKGLLGRLRG